MTDINNLIIIGRLTKDVDFGYTQNGTARINLSIATNRSVKQNGNWSDKASFFDVKVWGKMAENLKQYLSKGKQIAISGFLEQERWQKEVPERYFGESLETFKAETDEQKKALNIANEFVKFVHYKTFKTLVFLGSVGSGKTHLACGIIKELGGVYRMSSEISAELRKIKSFKTSKTEKELLSDYARENLLVIDEIGRSRDTTDEEYMLYQVINEFYNRRKPLVLISNQNKIDFLSYVGKAGIDRLSESATIFEFSGESYRKEMRAKQNQLRL